jgi:hypothetical protein
MLRKITTKIANKESLTTKRNLILIGLTTAVCGGYILFLAIAAPQQLAEATTAATNVVCNGCVGSRDIGDNSIQSVDIANGQVGSVDIGQGQVATGDIQDNGITSADLGNVITRVLGESVTLAGGEKGFRSATCPFGKILTGGGFFATGNEAHMVHVYDSHPADANTWSVSAHNQGAPVASVTPYALCI